MLNFVSACERRLATCEPSAGRRMRPARAISLPLHSYDGSIISEVAKMGRTSGGCRRPLSFVLFVSLASQAGILFTIKSSVRCRCGLALARPTKSLVS